MPPRTQNPKVNLRTFLSFLFVGCFVVAILVTPAILGKYLGSRWGLSLAALEGTFLAYAAARMPLAPSTMRLLLLGVVFLAIGAAVEFQRM